MLGRVEAGGPCAQQVVAAVADDLAVAILAILAIVAVTDPALVVLAGAVALAALAAPLRVRPTPPGGI